MSKTKREKKISKVMGEFKEGTLKSGGSGRKVTNPKQAIAIALSEANAMNQGGMMYNEIMNRPMFQTPQMREGGGIMAGIAPIRGYAEGDLVEGDDTFRPISAFADFLRNPQDFIDPQTVDEISNLTPERALEIIESNPGEAATLAILAAFPFLRAGRAGLQAFRANQARRPTKMTEADIAAPKPGPRTMSERDIMRTGPKSASRKADEPKTDAPKTDAPEADAAPGITARAKDFAGLVLKNPVKSLGGAAAGAGILDLGFGTNILSSSLDAALKAGRITREQYNQLLKTPEVSALLESFRTQPKPPTKPTTDVVVTEETGDDGDDEGTKKRGFIDMFRDANERLREFYSDPATQYGLAVAAQPTEGFVPRNALSDFIIGREQYKTLEADRDTALISNFNFLKENTDLSDEEILSKLSGERTSLDQFLSIFGPGIASGTVGAEDIARFSSLFNLEEGVSQPGITIDAEGKEVEQ